MSQKQIMVGVGALAAAGAAYYMITKNKNPKEMANDAKYAAKRELSNAEDKVKSAANTATSKAKDTFDDARDKIGDKIKR